MTPGLAASASADRFTRLSDACAPLADLKSSTVRGGAFAMTAEAVDFCLRMGSVVILARLVAPEHFGLVSMVFAITSVADQFRDFGLASATIQRPQITGEQVSTLFWLNTAFGVLLMLAIASLASPIAHFYGDARLRLITLAISTNFLWHGASSQHNALLRRTMKFGRIAAIQIAASALSIVVAVGLAWRGWGYWALVAREVCRNLFMAVGAWTCFPWVPGLPSRRADVRRMVGFGAEITGTNLVLSVSQGLDLMLIGKLFGAYQLGFYRQAFQLVLAPMNQLAYPVRVVTEAALSRLQHDAERYRQYYRNILSSLALATVPLGLFMAVYAEEVVAVVLGKRWLEAIPVFRILAIGAFFQPAVASTVGVMTTCGQSRKSLYIGVLSSAVLMTLFLAGIPFGPRGVASAHISTLVLLLMPRLYWSFRETPVTVRGFLSAVAGPIGSGVVMIVILAIFKRVTSFEKDAVRLGAGMVVAFLAYFGAWLALPRGREELRGKIVNLTVPLGLAHLLPPWLYPREA